MLDYIRERKDEVTYANAGLGGGSHICGMLLMSALDTQLTTVPYKGTGPAMTDLLGGQVDLMCDQATNTVGHDQGRQDQGLCRHHARADARAARPADPGRGRARGLRGDDLARALRTGGHARAA